MGYWYLFNQYFYQLTGILVPKKGEKMVRLSYGKKMPMESFTDK